MVLFDPHGALHETLRPTPGILTVHADEPMNANVLNTYPEAARNTRFFVPMKKDPEYVGFVRPPEEFLKSPDPSVLDWENVRPTLTALYSDTMAEAVQAYNDMLKTGIAAAVKSVRAMQKALELTPEQRNALGTAAEETPEPVWMSVPDPDPEVLIESMGPALTLNPGYVPAERMTWEEFLRQVENRSLTDYDGHGEIEIDGKVIQEGYPWISMRYVRVYDDLMVPFDRFQELLKDHEIYVHWWNK